MTDYPNFSQPTVDILITCNQCLSQLKIMIQEIPWLNSEKTLEQDFQNLLGELLEEWIVKQNTKSSVHGKMKLQNNI